MNRLIVVWIAIADIAQFRKYYEERLKAELERSDSGDRRAKLVNDLSPSLSADTSALTGSIADQAQIAVAYTIESVEDLSLNAAH